MLAFVNCSVAALLGTTNTLRVGRGRRTRFGDDLACLRTRSSAS